MKKIVPETHQCVIDKLDRKILHELELNSRRSYSRIAKKAGTSKEVVNYRIKRLVEENIITHFFTEINLAKLGMQLYKIYFQFQNVTDKKEEEMYRYFTEELKIPWIVTCIGRYDMIMSFGAKNIVHFDDHLAKIMNRFSDYIPNREISTTLFFNTYDRRWLYPTNEIRRTTVGGDIEQPKIDQMDYKILAHLSDNSRIHVLDLAKNLKLTSGAIINRMKNMEKSGIINRYRVGLNYKKLGKEFCKCFIYLSNKASAKEKELISYCETLPQMFTIIKMVGSWDIELELIVNNLDEFHTIMRDIKNRFDFVRSYESVIISKEYGINYFYFV